MIKDGHLRCDMEETCVAVVTHLDRKGYVYCERHGLARRLGQPCRKLRPSEVRKLASGEPLRRY